MALKMHKKEERRGKIKFILGVAAGKGGVGKSTLAVNLALALKQLQLSVAVLDADIYGPSIRKMLPEDRLPGKSGELLTPGLSYGIKVMTMAYFRQEKEATMVRAPLANNVVTQFVKFVDWGDVDILIVDFPPGTGDIQMTLTQLYKFNAMIMVTTPQQVAAIDVRKAITMFQHMNIPILGIVENMSYYKTTPEADEQFPFGKGGGARLSQQTGVPLLEEIPIEPGLSECGDQGKSLFSYFPESEAAKKLKHLAQIIYQQTDFSLHKEVNHGAK
jgi:ATP-binding protein involved in chromosome partitioning